MHCRTHPSTLWELPATSPVHPVHRTVRTVTVNVLRMHMPAATCRSRVGLEPSLPPKAQPAQLAQPAQAQLGAWSA